MTSPVVHVIDDDQSVRKALTMLLQGEGYNVRAHESAESFLEAFADDTPACLIVDLQMPGLSGLELLDHLSSKGHRPPAIVLTGHGDVPSAVKALRGGAVDFLQKPFASNLLLERISECVAKAESDKEQAAIDSQTRARIQSLTPREREVMQYIVAGKANKVIAIELGISERTVELHRSRLMHKMEIRSVAELTRTLLALERNGIA